MSTEYEIRNAFRSIWRNMPDGPTTFSTCSNRCSSGYLGRGGGICLQCAIDELAKIAGKGPAYEYADSVRNIRNLERKILEKGEE
jgi:hypothetical protein